MPRSSKGPRLWKRPARRKGGKVVAAAVWIIKDGGKHIATGCLAGKGTRAPAAAETALANYIASKYTPPRKQRDVDAIDFADVLSVYHTDTRARQSNPKKFDKRILRLNEFFGGKMLGEMTPSLSKQYEDSRGSPGGARRDLEDLRAAIKHHAKANLHNAVVHVELPEKGLPRDRWLTRSEAARVLWAMWRHREVQTVHRGPRKGEKVITEKRPLQHAARFVLIGLYTGTRAGSIAAASPERDPKRAFVDLERGIFYRRPAGRRITNKRQPPVPLPARLLAHMRRWQRKGIVSTCFVEWNGKPVTSVKNAFARGVKVAKLSTAAGNVTPHTLRHTAATWLMQRRTDPWQAAGFLGMSLKTLLETYGHHHPDYMQDAATAITKQDQKASISVVETVVDLNRHRERVRKTL